MPSYMASAVEEVHRGGQTFLVQVLAVVRKRMHKWPQKFIELGRGNYLPQ